METSGQQHAKLVIAQGHEWFGDKLVPMTGFMPFEQYLEFLKSFDIAIFNHQRQQAMGNTITLLVFRLVNSLINICYNRNRRSAIKGSHCAQTRSAV
jgi:hypothetical protein